MSKLRALQIVDVVPSYWYNITPEPPEQLPPIHASGLRHHGVTPSLSLLVKHDTVKPIAYYQLEVFKAIQLFTQLEGIVPAPESAH